MQSWETAVLVLVSIVAGAAIPVLVQLSMTLRSVRAALERTSARADRALESVTATAERFERATAGLDEQRVRALMESFDSLVRTVNQLRESARVAAAVGAAVGPAVGAAVRAWRAGRSEGGDGAPSREAGDGLDEKGGTR